MNFGVIAIAAIIPTTIRFVWYSNFLFGNSWVLAAGLDIEKQKKLNLPLVIGLGLLLSLMLSIALYMVVIHQSHINSIFADEKGISDPNSEVSLYLKDFMSRYGQNFRTFKHGFFHGMLTSIFIALPIIGINALWEQKCAKYIFINLGFWIMTLGLMGGILCQWA